MKKLISLFLILLSTVATTAIAAEALFEFEVLTGCPPSIHGCSQSHPRRRRRWTALGHRSWRGPTGCDRRIDHQGRGLGIGPQ
jgi:hypothetical protein